MWGLKPFFACHPVLHYPCEHELIISPAAMQGGKKFVAHHSAFCPSLSTVVLGLLLDVHVVVVSSKGIGGEVLALCCSLSAPLKRWWNSRSKI